MSVLEMYDIGIISSDTFFWSALGSSIVIPNLYVIQKWNQLSNYFHAPSFPGPKPVTIGKDLGVIYCYMYFAFPLHPLMTINQSKPISCPLSWMLQCYYLQIGCLCLLSIQKYSHVILGNSSYLFLHTPLILHFFCRSQTVLKEPYFGGILYPSTSIYIHPKGHTYKIPLMVLLLSSALGLPV